MTPCTPDREGTRPRPQFSVKPEVSLGGWEDLTLPRGYLYLDGDDTNAVICAGVNVGTKHGDPWVAFGLNLIIPPRLFWLVNPLYRREGRDLDVWPDPFSFWYGRLLAVFGVPKKRKRR